MMQDGNKQTLISLSLAGAIGFYLYTKLAQAGMAFAGISAGNSAADARTMDELSWRPEPVVMEPDLEPVVEETVEEVIEVAEEVVEVEETVEELVEEVVEEPVLEDPKETKACQFCGADNPVDAVECESCGIAFATEEPVSDLGQSLFAQDVGVVLDDNNQLDDLLAKNELDALDALLDDDDEADDDEAEDDEAAVDNLIETVAATPIEPEEPLMDNVEPLHKVEGTKSEREEFKNIVDFLSNL